MKVIDYLKSLPIGEVVTDKRALAIFKRMGEIYDYSPWGYLESTWVYRIDPYENDGRKDHTISYKPVTDIGTYDNPYPADSGKYYEHHSIDFTYKGMRFESKYLDGCFNAYLYKSGGDTTSDKTVNRRMSVFGSVC